MITLHTSHTVEHKVNITSLLRPRDLSPHRDTDGDACYQYHYPCDTHHDGHDVPHLGSPGVTVGQLMVTQVPGVVNLSQEKEREHCKMAV